HVGDRWRLNVVRVDTKSGDSNPAASSWNPITISDFHALDRMLTVVFADSAGGTVPGSPSTPNAIGNGSAAPPAEAGAGSAGSAAPASGSAAGSAVPASGSGSASAPISPARVIVNPNVGARFDTPGGAGGGSAGITGGSGVRSGSSSPRPQ